VTLALALAIGLALGQADPAPLPEPGDSALGARLTVSLLTFDPGAEVWERFGHNAIWISDSVAGTETAYDYGRFSFQEKSFVWRFARGLLRYWMGSGDARSYIAAYQQAGRSVWRQELRLDPAARGWLQRFLEWNLREENRYYRYDYYLDNCSTRIRDAIDQATGGAVSRYAQAKPGRMTYREHTRRTTENSVALYTALMMGLGEPVDRPITAWDEMFLPIELRPYLDSVRVADEDGRQVPLVADERELVVSDRYGVAEAPSDWTLGYLGAGVALGAILALLGRARRSSGAARRLFLVLATTWAWLAGLAGAVLLFLWGFTDHRFSVRNENLLLVNVLSLWLAFILPATIRSAPRVTVVAKRLAGVLAGMAALGLALKALPWFRQDNLAMIALVLPIHLGLWVGLLGTRPPAGASG